MGKRRRQLFDPVTTVSETNTEIYKRLGYIQTRNEKLNYVINKGLPSSIRAFLVGLYTVRVFKYIKPKHGPTGQFNIERISVSQSFLSFLFGIVLITFNVVYYKFYGSLLPVVVGFFKAWTPIKVIVPEFQDPASIAAEAIILVHEDVMAYLVGILILVIYLIYEYDYEFTWQKFAYKIHMNFGLYDVRKTLKRHSILGIKNARLIKSFEYVEFGRELTSRLQSFFRFKQYCTYTIMEDVKDLGVNIYYRTTAKRWGEILHVIILK